MWKGQLQKLYVYVWVCYPLASPQDNLHLWVTQTHHLFCLIKEHSSILYLGMTKEILNLPWLCISQIMTKEATNPKPSMQREWYCLAVHKILANVPLSTWELRNRPLKKSDFDIFLLSHTKLLTSITYKLNQLLSYFTQRTTSFS